MTLTISKGDERVGALDLATGEVSTEDKDLAAILAGFKADGIRYVSGGKKGKMFFTTEEMVPMDEKHAGLVMFELQQAGYECERS